MYEFLADEFRVDLLGQSGKTVVATAMFAIKNYFWIVQPTPSAVSVSPETSPGKSTH